jgi:VanZ family protein
MTSRFIVAGTIAGVVLISVVASVEPRAYSFIRTIPWADKAGHFGLFGLATLFVIRSLAFSKWRHVSGAALVAFVAILEEVLQILIPTRSFSLTDLSASLSGVFCFAVLSYLLSSQSRPTQNSRE